MGPLLSDVVEGIWDDFFPGSHCKGKNGSTNEQKLRFLWPAMPSLEPG
jgi:hypothetical protein